MGRLYSLPTVAHYGGGTEDGYTIYDKDGLKKGKNYLDRDAWKKDNRQWCLTT